MRWPWSKRIELVELDDDTDDAAATLTMMLRYHGRSVRPDEVVKALESIAQGWPSAGHMVEAAALFGMTVRGVIVGDVRDVAIMSTPCICHLSRTAHSFPRPESVRGDTRFAVLERVSTKTALVVDPESGVNSMPFSELVLFSTGVFLLFEPTTIPRARVLPS